MEFLLFIAALILTSIFSILGIFSAIIISVATLDAKGMNNYWMSMAVSLDQLGGVALSRLLNVTLIKKGSSNIFGNPDETISSVLGKNQKSNTLKYLGKRMVALLDWLDENHSIDSIEQL